MLGKFKNWNLKPGTWNLNARASRAFTLVELVVVVAIMTIISAIILANYNRFGGEVVLQDLAYDMALSIRQAQVYGISVTNANGNFNVGYGMYFASAATNSYLLFADTTPDGIWESTESIQTSTLAAGLKIAALYSPACASLSYNGSTFSCTGGGTAVTTLDILFVRPEPNAIISGQIHGVPENGDASCSLSTNNIESCTGGQPSAEIVVTDPKGDYKSVVVMSNGQITVQ